MKPFEVVLDFPTVTTTRLDLWQPLAETWRKPQTRVDRGLAVASGQCEKYFFGVAGGCALKTVRSRMVAQLQFDGVRVEIMLLTQVGHVVFAHIVVAQGDRA